LAEYSTRPPISRKSLKKSLHDVPVFGLDSRLPY
jgi:hypothetical protein